MKCLKEISLLILCLYCFSSCETKQDISPKTTTNNQQSIYWNFPYIPPCIEINMTTENKVKFLLYNIQTIDFSPLEHSITSGEPWTGINKSELKNNAYDLYIGAGRKKSKEVATWFKEKVTNKGEATASYTLEKLPNELNFAIKGDFYMKYKNEVYFGTDIVIAQGNINNRNNWWIGGKDMLRIEDENNDPYVVQKFYTAEEPIKNIVVEFRPGQSSSSVNVFYMRVIE